jgi:hypothetical protein
MTDKESPPVPAGPTPLGLDLAHPKQTSILRKVFKAHLKPKSKTHTKTRRSIKHHKTKWDSEYSYY